MRISVHGRTERESGFILLRTLVVSAALLLAVCAVLLVFAQGMRSGSAALEKVRVFVEEENDYVRQELKK